MHQSSSYAYVVGTLKLLDVLAPSRMHLHGEGPSDSHLLCACSEGLLTNSNSQSCLVHVFTPDYDCTTSSHFKKVLPSRMMLW